MLILADIAITLLGIMIIIETLSLKIIDVIDEMIIVRLF